MIQFFATEDAPATVGLLVDSSGSMLEARDQVAAAAAAFVETSNPQDDIFALAFNERVRAALPPEAPFTSDAAMMRAALTKALSTWGRTALYDAVVAGLEYVEKGRHQRKALLVVSDGGDNASAATFDNVVRRMQMSNTVIYTIAFVDPLQRDVNPGRLWRIAGLSGGEAFQPRRVGDVAGVLSHIARDIRHAYTIGYIPANGTTHDGRVRPVRVLVKAPGYRGLSVRTRQGYVRDQPFAEPQWRGKDDKQMAVWLRCGLRWVERALFLDGIVGLAGAYLTWKEAYFYQIRAQGELREMLAARDVPGRLGYTSVDPPFGTTEPFLGFLAIPRVGLSVPILEGDDTRTLTIAAGHLPGTPLPWDEGNTAIAGHRDTFFRPLKDVHVGDDVEWITREGNFQYRVVRAKVVGPNDVWVLGPWGGVDLTLVTCYPFSYIGPAPQRFVVQAERIARPGVSAED